MSHDLSKIKDWLNAGCTGEIPKTEIQLAIEALQKSRLDHVTGLNARIPFYEELHSALRLAYPSFEKTGHIPLVPDRLLAVLVGDVQVLSLLNALSHEHGDIALNEIGAIFSAELPNDSFSSRIGGDEFSAIIKGLSSLNIAALIKRITAEVRKDSRKNYGLDIGYADHCSILHFLLLSGENCQYFMSIPESRRIKSLADMFLKIASMSTLIAKSKSRLLTFVDILRVSGVHKLKGYMRYALKGAGTGSTVRTVAHTSIKRLTEIDLVVACTRDAIAARAKITSARRANDMQGLIDSWCFQVASGPYQAWLNRVTSRPEYKPTQVWWYRLWRSVLASIAFVLPGL